MSEDAQQQEGAEAEAAHWFARLKSVPLSRTTLEEFFAWRRIYGHEAAFDKVERLWSQTGAVSTLPSIVALTEQAYGNRQRRRPAWITRGLPAAAGVVLVATLTLFGPGWWRGDAYVTRIGEQSIVMLDDGSKVRLDTDTKMDVRYSRDARRVDLVRGQAYFTVAHNVARPFIVDADGTGVTATGTQFDVRRRGGAVDVTLVEGSVNVAPLDAAVTKLVSGQQLRVTPHHAPVVERVDTQAATAWTRGRIVLDGLTLGEALTEMNRYATKPVTLDAGRYAGERFSGTFETGDMAAFVAAATALLPLKAVHENDGRIRLVDAGVGRNGKDVMP